MVYLKKLFSVFVVMLFTTSSFSFSYAGRSRFSDSRKNVEVLKHLKRLNKPSVKTIKCPSGDIIDCVRISHQPAFDHPLLKNHTIQMTPNYHPNWKNNVSHEAIPQLWHLNGKCPEGTIPIRRTTKEDLLGAFSVESYGKKNFSTAAQTNPFNPGHVDPSTHIHSIAVVVQEELYGTRAIFNVWNPRLERSNEFSLGQLWITGGTPRDLNTIEVGWHVYPWIYHGDYNTRFFIYSTSDGYLNGCHNLLCGRFVQTSNELLIGAVIPSVSQLNGFQLEISVSVWQDPQTRNWWLQVGNDVLGYWPYTLFTHLSTGASSVQWGGEVMTFATGYKTSTQMGSGQFAQQGYSKSSYIRNIQVVDQSHTWNTPYVGAVIDNPNCYNIQTGINDVWGSYFYYGGPGRNPNCQ